VIEAGPREGQGLIWWKYTRQKMARSFLAQALNLPTNFSVNLQVNTCMWHFHRTFKSDKIIER